MTHKNVIKSSHFKNRAQRGCFTFLEFAENGDLDLALRNDPKKYSDPNSFFQKIKKLDLGIQAIHKQNIFHADLKTANIVIGTNGVFKIIDLYVSNHEE